jgi:hypothetical protein
LLPNSISIDVATMADLMHNEELFLMERLIEHAEITNA